VSPPRFHRVVGLGLCVVDHLYVVDDIRADATRTRLQDFLVSGGGMIATAVTQAAMMGCNAHIQSVVGDDESGRFLRRRLRRAGVKTGGLLRSREATLPAVVLVDRRSGERRFLVPDRRAGERRSPRFAPAPLDARTILLVDGHFPDQALRAVKHARERGAVVVGDFSEPRPSFLALLPYVDYPIVPGEFAAAYGGSDPHRTLHRLRERYGGTPVVTEGARGGLYLAGGRVRRYRARRVPGKPVRDTTGAGDVFHGAFAAALYHGADVALALDVASRAAALCCTALGGTTRLMTRGEMRRHLRSGAGLRVPR